MVEDDHLDTALYMGAYWKAVTLFSPFRTRGIAECWEADKYPTRRLVLHVLIREATSVPRARDGSASIETASSLMPKPFNDFQGLLGVMRPEAEQDSPMFIVLRDRTPDQDCSSPRAQHSVWSLGAMGGRRLFTPEVFDPQNSRVQPPLSSQTA